MPTESMPAVTAAGIRSPLGRISVIGPGQYASASLRAFSGISPSISARISSMQDTCTISGLSPGRPFASKMLRTAASSSAFAPSPYTVSVGKPTRLPSRISRPASLSAAASGFFTSVFIRFPFLRTMGTLGRAG